MQPQPTHRARQAEKIIANPRDYKICQGCESIVVAKAAMCPNCHGYRFERDSEEIIAHARLLSKRGQQSVAQSDLM